MSAWFAFVEYLYGEMFCNCSSRIPAAGNIAQARWCSSFIGLLRAAEGQIDFILKGFSSL